MNIIKLCIICGIASLIAGVTPGIIQLICIVIAFVSGAIFTINIYFKFKELFSP